MNQTYRSAFIILSVVILPGCSAALTAAVISAYAPSTAVVVSAGVAGVAVSEVAANQPEQPLVSETDIKLNKLVSVNSIALLKIPDPPLYGRDTALGEHPE